MENRKNFKLKEIPRLGQSAQGFDFEQKNNDLIEEQKRNIRKKYLKIGGIIFGSLVLILIVVILTLILWPLKTFSEQELSDGIELQLYLENERSFEIGEVVYTIRLEKMEATSIGLIFTDKKEKRNILQSSMSISKTKKFDLTGDEFYDISVKLKRIWPDFVVLEIERLNEPVCYEDWICGEWSECIRFTQERICEDKNNCDSMEDKPETVRRCTFGD